jgi:hypothetical protein
MKDADMPLLDRIEAALDRITNRQGLMRIPREATDIDVVVLDCGDEIKRLRAKLAQRTAERDEARRLLRAVVDMMRDNMLPDATHPKHLCDYRYRPDIAMCKVCEDWTDAMVLCYPDDFSNDKEAKP